LPVGVGDNRAQLPVISLAVAVPERVIVAHSIALSGPTAPRAARLLLQALSAPNTDGAVRGLRMNSGYTRAWRALVEALDGAGVNRLGRSATPVPSGEEITRVIGRKLGSLLLRPKLTHRTSEPANWRRERSSLPLPDLSAAIDAAVAEHNSKIQGKCPSIILAQGSARAALLHTLSALAQEVETPRPRTRK
jgi:hypothetical protein